MSDAGRIAELEQELLTLAHRAQRLVDELERIARLEDDAERGRALRQLLRDSPLLLPVPGNTRGARK